RAVPSRRAGRSARGARPLDGGRGTCPVVRRRRLRQAAALHQHHAADDGHRSVTAELPHDPLFDPVGIVVWAIDTGLYDLMYSAWGWPIAEIVHFIGLCLLIGTVGMFDLRMMGLVKGLSLTALHKLVPFGVFGFVLSAGSGFLFVVTSPDQYLYNPAWQVKMALLALAGLNMALFYLTTSRRLALF